MPPTDQILQPGILIGGRYEIESEAGSGAFGRVYRAHQRSTGQVVALKVLRFAEDADEDAVRVQVARFEREMRLCAELSHPNLVGLIDSGTTESGQPFVVFEYVPGQTLAEVIDAEGVLAPREALRVMGQVLDALAAAHRSGVVHRDLKPANIMIGGTGVIRNATLLDLGLGGFAFERREAMRRITGSREFAGTFRYAAPEQILGADPSERADLYSFGVILLECLTGQHPFSAQPEFGARIGAQKAPIPDALADHPIADVIARLLEPDVDAREVDAEWAMRALEDCSSVALDLSPHRAVAPRAVRRQLVVLSCRFSCDTPDVERADAALQAMAEHCRRIAEDQGGYVGARLAERLALNFGFPVAHENDVRRACRAGLGIAEVASTLSHRKGLPRVHVSMGVHVGPVIAREGESSSSSSSVEVTGPTPIIATQLDELAGPGEVVISESARRLLGDAMECEPIGAHSIRGAAAPIEAHRVVQDRVTSGDHSEQAPGCVGRRRQLRVLKESWEAASAGTSELITVQGEAGIGKSRLIRHFLAGLEQIRVIRGRCLEEYSDTPLSPFIELLRALHQDDGGGRYLRPRRVGCRPLARGADRCRGCCERSAAHDARAREGDRRAGAGGPALRSGKRRVDGARGRGPSLGRSDHA